MPIKLDWYNGTTDIEKQNIYRSDTPINEAVLPVPIGEVPNNVYTYTDDTVTQGKMYYYAIGSVKNGDVSLSRRLPIAYIVDTGPGPATIIRGDWEYGYFGTFPLATLVDSDTLKAILGFTGATTGIATIWHKFVIKGKIMFIPNANMLQTISWETIYRAGCAFGELAVPEYTSNRFGVVPQNKQITLDNKIYTVRLPTSRADYLDVENPVVTGGEVDYILSAVRLYRNAYYAPDYLGVDDHNDSQGTQSFWTTDFVATLPNSQAVVRGGVTSTPVSAGSVDRIASQVPTTGTSSYGVRFFLELVQ